MTKIYINEQQYKHNILNEKITDVVYHFSSLQAISKMAKGNKMYFQSALGKPNSDDYDKKKKFYISTTRQKNSTMGYASYYNNFNFGRIELNGEKLMENLSGKPIQYWPNGKSQYYGTGNNPQSDYYKNDKFSESQRIHHENEEEDRIFSNKPSLERLDEFVIRIDIMVNKKFMMDDYSYFKNITESKLFNKTYFYDNINEFNKQSSRTCDSMVLNFVKDNDGKEEIDKFETLRNRKNYSNLENSIAKIMLVKFFMEKNSFADSEIEDFSIEYVNRNGLEEFKGGLISSFYNELRKANNFERVLVNIIEDARNYSDTPTELGEIYLRLLHNFFKEKKVTSYAELLNKFKNKYYDTYNKRNDIDYIKPVKFLTCRTNYVKKVIPYPDNTPAKLIVNDDDLDNLCYEITGTIDDNGYIKTSYDAFFNYIKSLIVKNKISVNGLISLMKNYMKDKEFEYINDMYLKLEEQTIYFYEIGDEYILPQFNVIEDTAKEKTHDVIDKFYMKRT